jgi:hypothetical protein
MASGITVALIATASISDFTKAGTDSFLATAAHPIKANRTAMTETNRSARRPMKPFAVRNCTLW